MSCLAPLLPGEGRAAEHEDGEPLSLGFASDSTPGKASFLLDGQPFYPVVGSLDYRRPAVDGLRKEGANAALIAVDTEQAGSRQLRHALEVCREAGLPVLVEIHEWSYWQLLGQRPELNMVMHTGARVQHFPDYANPQVRAEHLRRYRRAAASVAEFAGSPVVAICVGAYDAYHLPDGEKHVQFSVPLHTRKHEVFLPFGEWARKAFTQFLKDRDLTPQNLGATSYEALQLPTTREDAGHEKLWHAWLLFRRELVTGWLADTARVVREETGLPVTATFDLNFSLVENFATPPFAWVDALDFLIVYGYGDNDPAQYLPPLLRAVYRPWNDAGKPLVVLLEFSSAISGPSPGDAYAAASAPFVSGLACTPPAPHLNHTQARVESFFTWTRDNAARLLSLTPPTATTAILVDTQAVYFQNPFTEDLARDHIPYDIIYTWPDRQIPDLSSYKQILTPPAFPSERMSTQL